MSRCIPTTENNGSNITLGTYSTLEECEQNCKECGGGQSCCSYRQEITGYAQLVGPNFPSEGWTVRYQYIDEFGWPFEGVGECEQFPERCTTIVEFGIPCLATVEGDEIYITVDGTGPSFEGAGGPLTYIVPKGYVGNCCGEDCVPNSQCCGTCRNSLAYLIFDFTEQECFDIGGSWSGSDCGFPSVDPCWTLEDAVAFFGRQPTSYAYIGPNGYLFEPQDCGIFCTVDFTHGPINGCTCCPNA